LDSVEYLPWIYFRIFIVESADGVNISNHTGKIKYSKHLDNTTLDDNMCKLTLLKFKM